MFAQARENAGGLMSAALNPIVVGLRDARRQQGLTQEELAARSGYGVTSLSFWERGLRQPGLQSLTDWAATLGLELSLQPTDEQS